MKTCALTPEQETQLEGYRADMFERAVGTVTNRAKAEKWALELTKESMKNPEIHWIKSPRKAKELYDSLGDSLGDSLTNSLRNSLRNSLEDSLWDSLTNSLWGSLRYSLWYSLRNSLWYSLGDSLWDSLTDSLWDSLTDFLWYSLGDSLGDSLWYSGAVAFYSFPEKIGLVKYDEKSGNQLKCYRKLMKHCFAIYALEGHIILVEKPVKTTVKDGKLIDIEFGD